MVPNTSERKTIPRDIFDSSFFCCQPPRGLKRLLGWHLPAPSRCGWPIGTNLPLSAPTHGGTVKLYSYLLSGYETVHVNLVEALQDFLGVMDFRFANLGVPTERTGKRRGNLVEQLPRHKAPECQ